MRKVLLLSLAVCLLSACGSDESILRKVGGEEDSLVARRIFREVPPTSQLWTEEHNRVPGAHYVALNTFDRIAEAAGRPDTAEAYRQRIYTTHPDSSVRAAFLYAAVRDAHKAGNDRKAARLYRRLTRELGETYYAEHAQQFSPDRAIQKGKQVPSFNFASIEDSSRTFTSEELRGKTYLMDFWGTWCGPCIQNMEHLHEAHEQYAGEEFGILSVSLHDEEGAVERFRENKWPMPWMNAQIEEGSQRQKEVVDKFEAVSFPHYILVNESGEIIATDRDLRNAEGEMQLNETLARVLNE